MVVITMPKNENIDAFWDIEDMLPKRAVKASAPRVPADTSAAEIVLDTPNAKTDDILIPPKTERNEGKSEAAAAVREYRKEGGLIQSVKISPWPTVFGFYEKFKKDALRNFERTHEPCEYVYFFSYMPQYEQMTVSQMAYYLYWRGEVRKNIYLKTDINYLFLYAYEIINLPEKVPPKEGAVLLSRLWGAYREDFRYLDKYLGEWLCDYCLVHNAEPDWTVLEIFADEIAAKVSLPEFYLKNGVLPFGMIAAISAYDYKKSKYYEPNRALYDEHIPAAMEYAANRVIMQNKEYYGIVPMRANRDSFSGAIACNSMKFKIEIMRCALRKSAARSSHDLKTIFANMIKLCENQVRAAVGIKSRFSPTGVDDRLKAEILSYFDGKLPNRNIKKTKQELEEEAYMALYEPKQNGPADISRALAIEKEAWDTAALLTTEDEDDIATETLTPPSDISESTPKENALSFDFSEDFPSGDFDFIRESLSDEQRKALAEALKGSFSVYCRSIGKMAENMRGEINEIAMAFIGDMLIEEDFSVIEDYTEDVQKILNLSL